MAIKSLRRVFNRIIIIPLKIIDCFLRSKIIRVLRKIKIVQIKIVSEFRKL